MSRTSPYHVLDMSWTCPLSWVFRSNAGYPPSPGWQCGPRRIIQVQVLIWYPTVAGFLQGTWTMSDILGKPYGYGAQLHLNLKPHPRHTHISSKCLGPSAKLESTPSLGWWSVVQWWWYRLEYAIPIILHKSLMVYMLCLTDLVSQRGLELSSTTPHTPHMFSNLFRISGPRSGNLQPLLCGEVVQWLWCRCGYGYTPVTGVLEDSWFISDMVKWDSMSLSWSSSLCHSTTRCGGAPWLDMKTGMIVIAQHVWCVIGETKAIWNAVNRNTLQPSPQ